MSREIKFRVWSKKHNTYLELLGLHYKGDKIDGMYVVEILAGISNVIFLEPEDVVLEQYTGLKDKNGKEIYEGDIIREKWYDNDVNRGRDRIGKIEYFCDRFVCWFGGTFVDLGMFPSENIEVIGNIHENPELLGGEE